MNEKNEDLLKAAKEYRDKYGWSVIPVRVTHDQQTGKFEKKPAVVWKPYMERVATDEELVVWFSNPDVNGLGVVTGKISDLIVLDWDSQEHCSYRSNCEVKTISGGRHIYYRYREGVRNTVRVAGKPLDVRGDGGFVVVPPTGLGDRRYEWVTCSGNRDLPPFPLLDQTCVGEKLEVATHLNVKEGERDAKLYELACSLLQKYSLDDAWQLLEGAARGYEGFGQTFFERDVTAKFDNAKRFLEQQGKLYIQRARFSVDPQGGAGASENNNFSFEPKLLSELKSSDYTAEWLWEGYVARGHITLLSALWKAGKTTLIAELFRAMQSESVFAGQNTKTCRVLYLSEERETQWVQRRDEKSITLPVHILCNPLKRKLKPHEWEAWIEKAAEYCAKHEIGLVVIDTMTTFSSVTDENDSAQVNAALLPLNYFREKNIAVLLIHHFRKSGGGEGTASRGSGALMSYVDVILEFSRLEPEDVNNSQRKLVGLSRFDETPGEVILDYTGSEYAAEVVTSSREAKKRNKANKLLDSIVKTIKSETIPTLFTSMDVWENWDDLLGKRPTERTVRSYLDELITMEKVKISNEKRKVGKTQAKQYELIDGGNPIGTIADSDDNYQTMADLLQNSEKGAV